MFQDLLNSKLVRGSKVLGVDLYINSDGSYDINCMVLSRSRNKILIENKFTALKYINEIEDKSLKGLPVCLSIDGKGILFKRVEKKSKQKLIHQLLPNAKETDFFLQLTESDRNHQYIAAIRNEILDTILDSFDKIKLFITNLYIGPFAVKNVIGLLENVEFVTNRYQFGSDTDNIISVSKIPEKTTIRFKIGDDELYQDELLVYATGLGFFIDYDEENLFEKVALSKSEFLYKQLFTILGWFSLVFFFSLLILNYFFFNQYNKKLNSANFKNRQNIEMIKKLDTLKSEFALKEEYFVSSGFLDASKQSYFADRIANTVPNEIQLTEMNINPLEGKFKNDKPLEFLMGKIRVSGNVSQSIILNNWVKRLKDLDWIREVIIIDYIHESTDSPAIFKLEIEIE